MDLSKLVTHHQSSFEPDTGFGLDSSSYHHLHQGFSSTTTSSPTNGSSDNVMVNVFNALLPGENTLKDYLDYYQDDGLPSDCNSSNNSTLEDTEMDTWSQNGARDYQFENNNVQTTNWTNPDGLDWYAYLSDSVYQETLDQLVTRVYLECSYPNLSTDHFNVYTNSYLLSSSPLSYEMVDDFTTVQPLSSHRYTALRANVFLLVKLGYKLALKLNNCDADERWVPSVAQKLLAVQYSQLSIKSEFLSTKVALDELESLLLREAVAAFSETAATDIKSIAFSTGEPHTDPCPTQLMSICTRIRGYGKLQYDDRVNLLTSTFFDLNVMKSVIIYDPSIDGWTCPGSGIRYERRDIFIVNQNLHDGLVHVIETFPDRWRNDLKAVVLIYLIVLFNPDLPELKYVDTISHEQYVYIYLLQRYLRSVCTKQCDASDDHYRLMVKIHEARELRKYMIETCESIKVGFVNLLRNSIASMAQKNELRWNKRCIKNHDDIKLR